MTFIPLGPLVVGLALLVGPGLAQHPGSGQDAGATPVAGVEDTSPEAHSAPREAMTVLDGVYTEEQAGRGRAISEEHCASCHGVNLRGTWNLGPSIVGYRFERHWVDLTLADLFAYIKETMPKDDPGKLSDPDYAAVLAYLLSRNDYPAGTTFELPVDPAAQELITIVGQ